jgi:hypothetical protein
MMWSLGTRTGTILHLFIPAQEEDGERRRDKIEEVYEGKENYKQEKRRARFVKYEGQENVDEFIYL